MKKRMVKEYDTSSSNIRLESTLGGVLKHVQSLIEKFGENAGFEMSVRFDSYIEEEITTEREETDYEYNRRIETEKMAAKMVEEEERVVYERLKAKYGND